MGDRANGHKHSGWGPQSLVKKWTRVDGRVATTWGGEGEMQNNGNLQMDRRPMAWRWRHWLCGRVRACSTVTHVCRRSSCERWQFERCKMMYFCKATAKRFKRPTKLHALPLAEALLLTSSTQHLHLTLFRRVFLPPIYPPVFHSSICWSRSAYPQNVNVSHSTVVRTVFK